MSHTRKERGVESSVSRQFPKLFPRGIILFSLRDNLVSAVWENNDCQMVKVRPSLHYARVFSVVGVCVCVQDLFLVQVRADRVSSHRTE